MLLSPSQILEHRIGCYLLEMLSSPSLDTATFLPHPPKIHLAGLRPAPAAVRSGRLVLLEPPLTSNKPSSTDRAPQRTSPSLRAPKHAAASYSFAVVATSFAELGTIRPLWKMQFRAHQGFDGWSRGRHLVPPGLQGVAMIFWVSWMYPCFMTHYVFLMFMF
jgi:hypothetical protein